MRNPILLILALFVSFSFLPVLVEAQPFYIERSNDEGVEYLEKEEYVDFSLEITHGAIKALINRQCPTWDFGQRMCTGRIPVAELDNELEDAKIAGLCFIPKWEIDATTDGNGRYPFKTTGLNVAVVLWKEHSNGPPEVILAGFENEQFGIESALPSRMANPGNRVISYPPAQVSVGGGAPTGGGVAQQPTMAAPELARYRATREFDFAFLPLRDYARIERYIGYYKQEQGQPIRKSTGIKVERAFKTMNVDEDANGIKDSIFEPTLFRSLLVKPVPEPDFAVYASEAALAYEIIKVCPPGWRDINAAVHEIVERSSPPNESSTAERAADRYLGVSAFAGVPLVDPISWSPLNYEIGLVYGLGKGWELETLLGRYQVPDLERVDGVSLQIKRFFNINNTKGLRPFLAGGLGAYDLPGTNTLGFIVDGGINWQFNSNQPLRMRRPTSSPFQLEAGLQYQNFNFLNSSPNGDLLSAKIGLRYIF